MKNIRVFCLKNLQFLEVNLSIYLNRCVFVMECEKYQFNISRTSMARTCFGPCKAVPDMSSLESRRRVDPKAYI